ASFCGGRQDDRTRRRYERSGRCLGGCCASLASRRDAWDRRRAGFCNSARGRRPGSRWWWRRGSSRPGERVRAGRIEDTEGSAGKEHECNNDGGNNAEKDVLVAERLFAAGGGALSPAGGIAMPMSSVS